MQSHEYIRFNRLPHRWCAGCGYGQVMRSLTWALEKVGATNENTVIVSGIGCWGHVDSYITTNAFHGTHGRALAFATGIKLAKPELNVIVILGDGDGVTIGGNHFIQACRRNVDVTAVLCNNFNYGMTGGQYSGTTPEHAITTTSMLGHIEDGFDVCKLAQGAGARYVARSISENVQQTADMIIAGIEHKGFSMIEVLSPCTVHFGRNNNMRRSSELYKWVKSLTVPMAAAKKLSEEQLEGKYALGTFVNNPGLDYSTKYREVQAKAMAKAGK